MRKALYLHIPTRYWWNSGISDPSKR